MARIAGVDIPRDKRVLISLTYIYGVGATRAQQAMEAIEIDSSTRVRDLSEEQVAKLRQYIEGTWQLEGDLRREVANNIKRKIEIGSYQGVRHRLGLPVRGQRTHTNARSRKGPKGSAAAVRKPTKKA